MLGKIICVLSDEFRQVKPVTRQFLSQIIERLDNYKPLEDIRPEIRTRFS
jgi:hypothetical protein